MNSTVKSSSEENDSVNGISLLDPEVDPRSLVPFFKIRTIETHTDEVWFCCFSPDGRYLATASKDSTVNIFEALRLKDPEYKPLVCKTASSGPVSYLAWSPNSTMLLACGSDNAVRLFNPKVSFLRPFLRQWAEAKRKKNQINKTR